MCDQNNLRLRLLKWLALIFAALLSLLSSLIVRADSPDGAALYRQWCSTCHGDHGQGLTEEWRATWPKGKQNCWQSRCHAGNHPPDGFSFPKEVPPLVGQTALTKFSSAGDLYNYTRATMPYWSPTLLSDEEYEAITSFLVEANYAEHGLSPVSLSSNFAAVPLPRSASPAEPAPAPTSPNSSGRVIGSLVALFLALAAGLALWLRLARPR
jgi:mono/diheme cytochrome c family protein